MSARILVSLFTAIPLLCSACAIAPVPEGDAPYSSERLAAAVDDCLKDETKILGTIVRVELPGAVSYEAAGGFTDLSRTTPLEPDTRFAIGSVTKLFTAVLVHQLMEKGQVRLDHPVIEYLPPDWSAILREMEHGDEITVEQALSHRTGITDVTDSESFKQSAYLDPAATWKPLDILRMVQQEKQVAFRPGENFGYSNTNYILLGKMIEQVSGLSYRQLLQKNVLDRIGLRRTFLVGETFGPFEETVARGYSAIGDGIHDGIGTHVEWAHAAGGIISTAGDLITFYRALASGDLFDEDGSYQRMCRLVGHNESYGLGLEITDDPDIGLYYGHRGNFMGTRTILAHFPADRMTLVVAHTYQGFSLTHPVDLMKRIVHGIRGDAPAVQADAEPEGPEILSDTSLLVSSEDAPAMGPWEFAPEEEWGLDRLGEYPLDMVGDIHVDDDGTLFLLDRGSATVIVLDPDGNVLRSFGGHGDGPRLENPRDLFLTPGYVHVLDIGRSRDRIKSYDKSGNYVETSDLEQGVSPRLFIDDDRYLAVRTGPDVLKRPTHELLEILSLKGKTGPVLAKLPADDKLVLETMAPMGRLILLEDDVNLFPRLIVHLDGDMLYLGRSDRYLVKKIDLGGGEQLAFSNVGRKREMLPRDYAASLAERTKVAGKELTGETKERFLAGIPERQVFFTKIAADENGLIYVFTPDITDTGTQGLDIFSQEGRYLYHASVVLPGGAKRIRPLEFEGGRLYALVRSEQGTTRLIKYGIRPPARVS